MIYAKVKYFIDIEYIKIRKIEKIEGNKCKIYLYIAKN